MIDQQSFNQGREAGIREALGEAAKEHAALVKDCPDDGGKHTLIMAQQLILAAISALLTQPPEGEQK